MPPVRTDSQDPDTASRLTGVPLGRPLGVRVTLHPTALLVALLIGWVQYERFSGFVPRPSTTVAMLAAAAAALGFVVSILVHELAHAAVARALRLPVVGVSVFLLGGFTRMGREPEEPGDEFAIALSGPLASLLLGTVLAVPWRLTALGSAPREVLFMLTALNGLVAVFNLLPGHPLDGGALVRAALWRLGRSRAQAQRLAARAGQGLGALLVGLGVVLALSAAPEGGFDGLWLALIGLFVLGAAKAGVVQADVRGHLDGLTVGDLAHAVPWRGESAWTLARVTADVYRTQASGVVIEEGRAVGALGVPELDEVPSSSWEQLTLGEVMRPTAGTVEVTAPVLDVLHRLRRGALLVVTDHDGTPVGLLRVEDVLDRMQAA